MRSLNSLRMLLGLALCLTITPGCGGGGSSGSSEKDILVEGLLTEGAGDSHGARTKHDAGSPIETVNICAMGKCSETDGLGQWGFTISKDLARGDVLFTVNGHGINSEVVAKLPETGNEIYLHFEHSKGTVIVHHLMVDGTRVEPAANSDVHVH